MTRKDKLIQYIESLLPEEILVVEEYHLKDGVKLDERRSIHEFNCDSNTTKLLIETNFDSQLYGSYTLDDEGNPIEGVLALIDRWGKGERTYPEETTGEEGGSE